MQSKNHLVPQPHASILKISPYVGGDITPPGMVRRIALASNENALGSNPSLFETLQEAAQRAHLYPSGDAKDLKITLGEKHGLDPSRLLCSNGSEDILHLIVRTFAGPGDEVIFPQYGFMVYNIATLSTQATPVPFPQPYLTTSVEAILKAVTSRTKVIFLDHPGNPLGTYLSKEDLYHLHAQIPPHIVLVIDAAYAEYLNDLPDYTDGLELAKTASNVVVTRTFSKIYGLAGLRVGWAYAAPEIVQAIMQIRPAFNVNHFAQMAAIKALQDHNRWIEQCQDHVRTWRLWTVKRLTELGLGVQLGYGNFVLVKFPEKGNLSASEAYPYLGKKGILVRPVTAYGLPHHLRITIGKGEEMQELLSHLNDFMTKPQSL